MRPKQFSRKLHAPGTAHAGQGSRTCHHLHSEGGIHRSLAGCGTTVNGEDQELRVVYAWREEDFRRNAVAIPIFLLAGLALIGLGIDRCVDYPFSRSPQTFLSGIIPIAGGIVLIFLAGFGVQRRFRQKKRSNETIA